MAEPIKNGTYVIVSAMNTSRAIDVNGQSDKNGANVQLWTINYTSGQYVTVTGSEGNRVLRFPLTGRVMDAMYNTAKNGTNIIQWPGNNGKNQAWNIVPDPNGQKVTINGNTYDLYFIKSALNNNFVIDAYGQSTTPGTNIQLWENNGGNNQKWAFIKVPLLPAGNYRLISALDQKSCVTIANTNNGANVQSSIVNLEDNNQIWNVSNGVANCNIKNYGSSCFMHATNDGISGSTVNQSAKIDGQATSWLMRVTGTMKYNGNTHPLVTIALELNSDKVLDVGGGVNKLITDVRVYSSNNGNGQKFIAVPATPLDKNIAAPSGLQMSYTKGGSTFVNPWGINKITCYPNWISNYTQFQFRYRHRSRNASAGDEVFSSWSAWQFYGNTANDGWGDVSKANLATTLLRAPNGNNRRYSNVGHTYTISTTGNDCIEYQYQVRAIANGKRGVVSTLTGRYKYQPTLTIKSIVWSPEGLRIQYASDQKRNNNDLVVYKIICAHGGKQYTMLDGGDKGYLLNDIVWNGVATIPQSKLKYIPSSGDMVSITFTFSNVDGAYRYHKQTVSKACSLDSGQGLTFQPVIDDTASHKMLHVKANVTGASKYRLWIDYDDDRNYFHQYSDTDGEWYIPVLFDRAYRVYLLVEKGAAWGVYTELRPAIKSPYNYWFNFVNYSTKKQDYVNLMLSTDEAMPFTRTIRPSSDFQMTNGNSLEVAHFGYGRSESLSLEGAIPLKFTIPNSSIPKFEALALSHYAWLRSKSIYMNAAYRIAIESIQFSYKSPGYSTVSISCRRIDDPSDW